MSESEKTFGQRYTRGQALHTYISGIEGYAPSNPLITVEGFGDHLTAVNAGNVKVGSTWTALSTCRDQRYVLFHGNGGVVKRSQMIRDYVSSMSETARKSHSYKQIQKLVQRFNPPRPVKTEPATPPPEGGSETVKSISQSEVSFGSMLQTGKDVLEVVKQITGYAPSNTLLDITNFGDFLAQVDAKNKEVAAMLKAYEDAVDERVVLYDTLRTRFTQIKDYIAGTYGKDSPTYENVQQYQY